MNPQQVATEAGRRAIVSRIDACATFAAVPGEAMSIRVHSADVGGRFTIVDSTAAPMASPPMHYHREEEIFEILEGTLTFVCDGATFEAEPGAIVVVPAGAHHSWINLTTAPVRMRVTFMPGGIEANLFPFLAKASAAEIDALAARHGTVVVGAPLDR